VSALSKIMEYMKLLRLWNGLIAALAVLLAVLVSLGWEDIGDRFWGMITGVVIVIIFMGAGNSLNDYFDVENDRVAHPNRPLVKGTINKRIALTVSAVLFAICIMLSVFLNPLSIAIIILAMIAMVEYELRFKNSGFLGNVMIAILVAGLFLFGGAIVDNIESVLILASLAGLATLGREIVKDIEDMEGDVLRNSLPKRIGARKAGFVAIAPVMAAVFLSPIPYIWEHLDAPYLYIVLVADALFIVGAFLQLKNPRNGQRIFKVAMVLALIAFAVGVPI